VAACLPAAALADGKITWLVSSTSDQLSGYQKLFARFTEETGIGADIIATDYNELYSKLQSMIAAKQVPEVASWGTEFVTWAGRGAMTPLDDYIARDGFDLSQFDENALNSMRWDGKLWQLPYSVNTCILYYNEELFEKAGITPPTTDWSDSNWTFEKFIDLAQQLTLDDKGRNAKDPDFDANNIVQFGVGGMQAWWFYPWYYGGDWTNKEATEYTGNAPEAVQGVQQVYDLINKYHVMPNTAQSQALASGGNLFLTGKIAMVVDGNWACSSYKEATFKWNIACSPVGTQHSVVLFTDGFGIGGGSANPDGMWEFLKWFYGNKDNVLEYMGASSGYLCIPAYKPVQADVAAKITENYPGLNVDVLMNAISLPEAQPVYMRYNVNWNEINTTLSNEVIDPVSSGETTAQETMAGDDFVTSMNDLINQAS
jgi:multiple sugar transport system substrate-binding protein